MQNHIFSPKIDESSHDIVATTLAKIARTILVVVLGISPLFFIPVLSAPFSFTKILFVMVGVLTSLVFFSLSVLRSGTFSLKVSFGLYSTWLLAFLVAVSALFSGDISDSFFGEDFGSHTAVFVALLALIISVITILSESKKSVLNLYMLLTASGLLVGLYQIMRLIFGSDFLTLGVFLSSTSTPLGGWNDLALFFGLSIILALVAVEQFPLTKWGRALFGLVAGISLIILSVVNFVAIWVVLALVSLIVLMYALTKNRNQQSQLSLEDESSSTISSVVLSIIVFIFSVTFLIGGSGIGQFISTYSGVSYVEVRPSLQATLDVTRNVFKENAFTGVGPNKFVDAWRQYKDPSINQTIFWNVPFDSGIGYISTFAATTGIFGLLAWFIFFFFIVRAGIKVLFIKAQVDRFWYFVGTSSFVSVLYLWGMSIIYVPGPAILMLAAVFTGVLYTAHYIMFPPKSLKLSINSSPRTGFVLVALTVIVIVSSVTALYLAGKQYSAVVQFNKVIASMQVGTSVSEIEQKIANSFQLSSNDRFVREMLGLQVNKMSSLLSIKEPSEAQKQQFQSALANAVSAGQLAVELDPTEPLNWQGLGSLYSVLTMAGIEGSYNLANDAFNNALKFDPTNPSILFQQALLESRTGNLDKAKELARKTIQLKQNYNEALLLIAQIDVAQGDVDGAIESTLSSITLEPRNPARYYQLGVLYYSKKNINLAIRAFESAISFDNNYANARYFLGISYIQSGRTDDAVVQLEKVLELNQGNEDIINLIDKLQNGDLNSFVTNAPSSVKEEEAVINDDGEVTATNDPHSPLLSPVNSIPANKDESRTFTNENASSTKTDNVQANTTQ